MPTAQRLDALAAIALLNATTLREVNASGEVDAREVTGEDILATFQTSGGEILHVERDEAGVISEIVACGQRCLFDEDTNGDERGGVLSNVEAAGLPKKIVGDLAQTSVTNFLAAVGTYTSGSTALTLAAAVAGTAAGQAITGPGIPAGTTIASGSGTAFVLSQATTAAGTSAAVSFAQEVQVIGLGEWTIDWKRKTVEATTTDDATYESSLPSTASWTVKAKYMFLVGDSSQAAAITASMQAQQAPQVWSFFPDVTVGHPAYTGYAYVDGITISSGTGKLVGLDVSLKGTGPLTTTVQLAPQPSTNTVTALQAED